MSKPEMTYQEWLIGMALQGILSGRLVDDTYYKDGDKMNYQEMAKRAVQLANLTIQEKNNNK